MNIRTPNRIAHELMFMALEIRFFFVFIKSLKFGHVKPAAQPTKKKTNQNMNEIYVSILWYKFPSQHSPTYAAMENDKMEMCVRFDVKNGDVDVFIHNSCI